MLATNKKQSITTRLMFYAKLADKLDAIGQQLVDLIILNDFQQQPTLNAERTEQAVTVEQLISKSQVYNSLQFVVTGRNGKREEVSKAVEKSNMRKGENVGILQEYLIDKYVMWRKVEHNLVRSLPQIVILFSMLLISLLVSAICLSPAFRNQLYVFAFFFVNSFNQFIGLNGLFSKRSIATSDGYCKLPVMNGLQSAFLPPFNCDYCSNLTRIAKVSNLDYHQFQKSYLNRLVPVVIQDATEQWSALNEFTVDFLKALYIETDGSLSYHDSNCQFFPYKTSYRSLADALNNITTDQLDWYIGWSNCDSRIANILRKYYQRPYFLPPDSLLTKTDWLFMGSVGYGAHMHIDNVGNPSWQAQIKGSKIWTVKPPFECLFKCQTLEVQVDAGEITSQKLLISYWMVGRFFILVLLVLV